MWMVWNLNSTYLLLVFIPLKSYILARCIPFNSISYYFMQWVFKCIHMYINLLFFISFLHVRFSICNHFLPFLVSPQWVVRALRSCLGVFYSSFLEDVSLGVECQGDRHLLPVPKVSFHFFGLPLCLPIRLVLRAGDLPLFVLRLFLRVLLCVQCSALLFWSAQVWISFYLSCLVCIGNWMWSLMSCISFEKLPAVMDCSCPILSSPSGTPVTRCVLWLPALFFLSIFLCALFWIFSSALFFN